MKNLAIIPARGGSKRIPRKNIKLFLGKPIIAYSIETAIESNLFDEVMVSTDDKEIVEVAKKYGAKVPFLRSKKNADDFATTFDVIKEVIEGYKEKEFDYTCCLYPTAPFVTPNRLKETFSYLVKNKLDSVFPVIPFSFPIQRSLKFKRDNKLDYFLNPKDYLKRSQDLEKTYHDAGQYYFFKTDAVISKKNILTNNTSGIVISELEAQDIDTETDWKLAELKYKLSLANT